MGWGLSTSEPWQVAQGRHTASAQFLLAGKMGRSTGLGLATPSDQACLLPLKMSQR